MEYKLKNATTFKMVVLIDSSNKTEPEACHTDSGSVNSVTCELYEQRYEGLVYQPFFYIYASFIKD